MLPSTLLLLSGQIRNGFFGREHHHEPKKEERADEDHHVGAVVDETFPESGVGHVVPQSLQELQNICHNSLFYLINQKC